MKQLEAIHIVQFSFFEADTFETRGNLTILGANGVGKTSVLDAIQIAMLGGHGKYVSYNSQLISSVKGKGRTLKDYCLGAMRPDESASDNPANEDIISPGILRKREHAQSYITLVFSDHKTGESISAGICLSATILETDHRLQGLYVAPSVKLTLDDHLQAIDGGTAPLDWESFGIELRQRAKRAGRTCHISTHPEAYVDELLHAIQPSARYIDKHAFVRAFKKSMELKDIENVNDFVRDYLVDAKPINKQVALSQILRFRQLKTLIRETEEQIQQLGQIHQDHTTLLKAHQRRDTAIAVKSKLNLEHHENKIDKLKQELHQLNEDLSAITPQIQNIEQRKIEITEAIEDLIQQIARDPASFDLEQNNKLRSALQSRLNDNMKTLRKWHLDIRETLRSVCDALANTEQDTLSTIHNFLSQYDTIITKGNFADLPNMKSVRDQLVALQNPLSSYLEVAKQSENSAGLHLRSLLGQTKAINQGAGRLSPAIGAAIDFFHENGIECHPISALIKIKHRDWQAAIEAFLGPHRESLVVQDGKEREAVRLLRQFREHADWLFNVTIVQPSHLKVEDHRTPKEDFVASLVVGENENAVTYVRQLLGRMRCVTTEEELERHSRALSSDGMLSANGGTRRLRLPDAEDWLIGSKLSESQKKDLFEQVVVAKDSHEQAKREYALLLRARDLVREILKAVDLPSYNDVLNALRSTQSELDRLPDPSTIKEPEHLIKLRRDKRKADELLKTLGSELSELSNAAASKKTLITKNQDDFNAAEKHLAFLKEEYENSIQAQDFNEELENSLYQKVNSEYEGMRAITECTEISEKANERISKISSQVVNAFLHYIDLYNIALLDERSDWRLAKKWVETRLSKLKDSELVIYREEADEALKAAEDAFRQDIAYRLREAIHRLEQGIQQLNKILKACPKFSGNEHYQFIAKPAKAYEKIYKFIKHIDEIEEREGNTGSLLSNTDDADTSDARKEILDQLEASASSDSQRIQNPLEDYRLLYNFDLEIFQGEERIGSLSRRIGLASNGEHRVPFYVIAGAALSSAYRIQAGKKNDGAALMLLDEAFYGMDSQNSYATAQFLRGLGIQLIMAGPESDHGKLAPMTDSMYELTRYSSDVFLEVTHFTDQMHQLMTSDMPMLHPELIDETEKVITEEAK